MSPHPHSPQELPPAVDSRYQESIDYLLSRINYERRPELARGDDSFHLERMRRLLGELGNPQFAVPCVHIAGSKGKGSTATMVARVLEESGLKVGLFTSPHAHRFEERFTVNKRLPDESEVVEIVERLRTACEAVESTIASAPTFFELATAAGWLHFQRQQVDIAVIEVGLGGRLDSTNVCQPLVCIITSISKDHTRLLGDTEELIAGEKAGIIKNGVPVVSGVIRTGPSEVIRQRASQHSSPYFEIGKNFQIQTFEPAAGSLSPWSFRYESQSYKLDLVRLAMPGEHQARNAALAVTAAKLLSVHGYEIPDAAIAGGLAKAVIPLRIEIVGERPIVLIDAAHNPASIEALCKTLQAHPAEHRLCVFASSRDKDCAELMRILDNSFDQFILCAYQKNPRSIPIDELANIASNVLTKPFEVVADPESAMLAAINAASTDDLICATGSFFLAAEVEEWWRSRSK